MPTDDDIPAGLSPQTLTAVGVLALGVLGLYVVSQGTTGLGVPLFAGVVQVLVSQSVMVLLWLAAAAGWGRAIWRALGGARGQWAVAMALGVGAMAMGDWALGIAGWLSNTTAWALAGAGWTLLGLWAYRRREQWYRQPDRWPTLPWAILLAVPALALLIGACAMPPGTLWITPGNTEGGGYDVLSYHLQLPKEWINDGAIRGYAHNAYSYMPNLFEAAYTHIGWWTGGMVAGSYGAQLLHAACALIAAAAVAQVVIAHTAKPMAGAFAAAVYLALPWTTVTGSMAYNEHFIAALGIAALGLALNRDATVGFGANWLEDHPSSQAPDTDPHSKPSGAILRAFRTGAAIGLLVGLATLGKLTAIGMFGLPIGVVLLLRFDRSYTTWLTRGAAAAGFGLLVVSAWFVRNAVWTGNPVFPMFAETFGSAHWSAEQVARWDAAHTPETSVTGIAVDLWRNGLAYPLYAYVFWPAVIVASVLAVIDKRTRRVAALVAVVLVAQLVFWTLFTHHQSRFLMPMVGPGCIAIGLAVGVWRWDRLLLGIASASVVAYICFALRRLFLLGDWQVVRYAFAACVVLAAAFGIWRLSTHAFRAAAGVAFIALLTGVGYWLYIGTHGEFAPRMIDNIAIRTVPDARYGPHFPAAGINALPPHSRIYAEAWATPYYAFRPVDYQTVWDTSRLGAALEQGGINGARDWLKRAGYTHVIIDWGMLELWSSPDNYGYDPSITRDRLITFTDAALEPIGQPWGPIVLYRVRPNR